MHTAHTAEEIEEADFRQVAVPQATLVFPEGCTRGEAIELLARAIPANEYGLPLFYVRSDHLDLHRVIHQGHITQDEADGAAELLSYHDGYPTFKQGSPFWTQMPHEPHTAYLLFQRYLDLSESEGIRLIDSLARLENVPLEQVRSYFAEFFWSSRARAYDLFIVAAEQKKREVRTRRTENKHFDKASEFFDALTNRLTDEKLDELSATELLDALEQMVKIQRLSLGLTGQAASTINKDLAPAASVEVILRQLTKNSGQEQEGAESIQNRLALLMQDQDTAMNIQEMIVKVTSSNQTTPGAPPT